MEFFTAIEDKKNLRLAIQKWTQAFDEMGVKLSEKVTWSRDHGIFLGNWSRDEGHRYRYWFGLSSGSESNERQLIVEVNPPDGGLPGRFQGMLATDTTDDVWLLHAGEINVNMKRVFLKDFDGKHDLSSVQVGFTDGKSKPYYVVANLSLASSEIVRSTKRFVDACTLVRNASAGEDEAFIEIQEKAILLEESTTSYLIPAQSEKIIEKTHGEVWRDLRLALENSGNKVSNARIGKLGPDLFTLGEQAKLYEIKTDAGASDCLKAVGQLLVYERHLKRSFGKALVVPRLPSESMRSVLRELEIEVITFEKVGNSFDFSSL